ncbi:MAG: hybrid sensor histidine kinase/response regulator [Spirochaetota bacterium]
MIKSFYSPNESNFLHLFLVDDKEENLLIVSRVLEREGFTTQTADSAESCLELLQSASIMPDLFLLDVDMPGMDGFELCQEIKARPNFQNIPVIFLSQFNEEEKVVQAYSLGACDYIVRPFRRQELVARIKYHANIKTWTEELLTANQTKDNFFSIIAHDLRSPLSGLLGVSQILLEDVNLMSREEITEISNQITNSAKVLFNLLENLLEWSRIQTGQLKHDPQQVNLIEIFENIEGLFIGVAMQKKINLHLPYGSDSVHVFADENMLFTVLRNLVSNALKFTKEGGTVSIAYEGDETGYMQISVSDSGIGIPEAILEKLFVVGETKTRLGTNQEKGTGLGLILVKDLVELNKGKITAESEISKGTTFRFTVPLLEQ